MLARRAGIMLAVWFFACSLPAWGFVDHATAEYGYAKLQGHGVYVSPEAMADKAMMNRVLVKLDADLKKIHELLPPAAMKPTRRGHLLGRARQSGHDGVLPRTKGDRNQSG